MSPDLADLPATALLHGFRTGAFTPLDCWDAVEARVSAWEPTIQALYLYRPERARAEAAASTDRWRRGEPVGPLDGVPATLKELIATEGDPVPLGTAATLPVPAAADAPVAARLREDGAILFAKTTCPDYGMLSSGLSSFHPLSRNPWDPAMNPGGSSAGAGAAAAAGYGPLHLGTDIGGSIRIPAGWTGTFGFKPSNGRIPIDPYTVGRCAGPMTRTVADAALVMPTLSRPDWRDAMSLPPERLDWTARAPDLKGLRVGLMLEGGCGLPVDAEVRDAVAAAAKLFEGAGANVTPVRPVLTAAMLDGLNDFWRARFWGEMLALPEERRGTVLPYILTWASAAEGLSGVRVARGFDQTIAMRRACAALFSGVDAVLSPTNPVVGFPAEHASPTNDPARPFDHIAFTVPWNMSEQPAASISCGFSRTGLPIGLQIVGPRFGDVLVLQLSRTFEDWRGPIAWPSPGGA